MLGDLLMMSIPWMKKGWKCAFAKKKGVGFIIHLVSKSSLFFSLISIILMTTLLQVNQSRLLNDVFLKIIKLNYYNMHSC